MHSTQFSELEISWGQSRILRAPKKRDRVEKEKQGSTDNQMAMQSVTTSHVQAHLTFLTSPPHKLVILILQRKRLQKLSMFSQEQTVCKLAEVGFRVGSPLHFLVHLPVFHGQTSAKSSDRDCTNLRTFYNIQMLESKE